MAYVEEVRTTRACVQAFHQHDDTLQAEHTRVVKALYDYEAAQSTELSISENDVLYVYGEDDDWILVRKQSDDSRVGYVPGNYVEEARLMS